MDLEEAANLRMAGFFMMISSGSGSCSEPVLKRCGLVTRVYCLLFSSSSSPEPLLVALEPAGVSFCGFLRLV